MSNKKKNKDSEKLNPYFIDKLASVPAYLKIGFLKFWLAGASFLLAIYGLGARFDLLDRLVVFALVMILGVEYLTNTVILYMNKPDSCCHAFMYPFLFRTMDVIGPYYFGRNTFGVFNRPDKLWTVVCGLRPIMDKCKKVN
jgi:hypothetical protein